MISLFRSSLGKLFSSTWFRLALSGLLLAVVFASIDLPSTFEALRSVRPDYFLAAIAISIFGRFYAALRWYVLLHGRSVEITYGRIVKLTFVSTFLGFLLPGTVGTEIARVYSLSRATSDLALSLSSVVVERALTSGALIIYALVALMLAPPGLPAAVAGFAWAAFAILVVGGIALMNRRARGIGDWILGPSWLSPVRLRLAKFYRALDAYKQQRRTIAWSLAAAAVSPLFRIVPFVLGVWALELEISIMHVLIFVPIIVFVAQLPISLGGLGVREVSFVTLLGSIGVQAEYAVALSLLIYFIAVVSNLPGAYFYTREGLSKRSDPNLSSG